MTNFNLSVGITDSFMQALTRRSTYALINPHTNKPTRRVSAQLGANRGILRINHPDILD